MLFHRSHSFYYFGMSGYYNRNCGSLSLSKRTQSCGFRHFSVLAWSHAILPLEHCVELAHTLIPHSLRNLLNGHPGGADQLLCPPEIVTRGFVYVKESEELLHQLRDVAQKTVDAMSARKRRDDGEVSRAVRSAVSSYLYKHTKRSPMVIPMEIRLTPVL